MIGTFVTAGKVSCKLPSNGEPLVELTKSDQMQQEDSQERSSEKVLSLEKMTKDDNPINVRSAKMLRPIRRASQLKPIRDVRKNRRIQLRIRKVLAKMEKVQAVLRKLRIY